LNVALPFVWERQPLKYIAYKHMSLSRRHSVGDELFVDELNRGNAQHWRRPLAGLEMPDGLPLVSDLGIRRFALRLTDYHLRDISECRDRLLGFPRRRRTARRMTQLDSQIHFTEPPRPLS
jgi:hypothetical protein